MLGHSCAGWSKNKPAFSPETACAVCPIWLLHCSQRAWVELTRLQDMLRGLFLSNNESQEIWISTTFSLRHPRAWVQTIVFIGLTDDKIVTEVWFCSSTCFVTVYVQKRLQMISQEWLIPVNVLFLYYLTSVQHLIQQTIKFWVRISGTDLQWFRSDLTNSNCFVTLALCIWHQIVESPKDPYCVLLLGQIINTLYQN